jgi:hypothetical protein
MKAARDSALRSSINRREPLKTDRRNTAPKVRNVTAIAKSNFRFARYVKERCEP